MWQEARKFIFRGTDLLGIPLTAKVIVKATMSECSCRLRIYDETNRKDVAYWEGINNTKWEVLSTELLNLPFEEAVFSIQGEAEKYNLDLAGLIIEF